MMASQLTASPAMAAHAAAQCVVTGATAVPTATRALSLRAPLLARRCRPALAQLVRNDDAEEENDKEEEAEAPDEEDDDFLDELDLILKPNGFNP